MSARRPILILAALCLALAGLLPATASAAPEPAWTLAATAEPANFAPGAGGEYVVVATNVGAKATSGSESELQITIPAGLKVIGTSALNRDPATATQPTCTAPPAQVITCKTPETVGSGRVLIAQVQVEVPLATPEGTLNAQASVSGGGAGTIAATAPTLIGPDPVPFDFLPARSALLTEEDGEPASRAGSDPYQQTIAFGFPTRNLGAGLTNDGHPRDIYIDLPRGMVGSPAASPILCTEAKLTGEEGCPDESQVGMVDVTSLIGEKGNNTVIESNLYNMVPPPGAVAEIATNVADSGVFLHSIVGVRSDRDFEVEAATHDVIAFGQTPIFNVQAQVWGDPSSPAHERIRGNCHDSKNTCPVEPQNTPFLTLPGECPGTPPLFHLSADTWEKPSPAFGEREVSIPATDRSGQTQVSIEGCDAMEFEPAISAQPTTNLTDSPSGLDVTLHQPQETELEDPTPPAAAKDVTVRFPAGLAINPSQAAGLGACSEAQIGYTTTKGSAPRFSMAPQSCPAQAKIGSFEVSSPALIARTPDQEVAEDPASEKPIQEVLHGSVYVAQPFANPFKALIAVYLALEDEKTGILAKLAGRGDLDPATGQITTTFKENPELPLEDVRVHIFGGPRGSFTTPPTCNTYSTETELVPWSAPQGNAANPQSAFQTTAAPSGGACPTSEAQLPNAPKLGAGTLDPAAGKYSPLIFKLSREDGSQRLAKIEATLPSGLIAKLAGVGTCSEADIAKARSREEPQKGALEQADPSCPASSQVGTVVASAGSGPTPYFTQGHAYLAGPYKGAPISIVAIAPAVAGPFDLGTVVSRSAVYLDPTTAQGRVVSDPLPTILDGIPLDLRSVAVRADRPGFSLNPTSCAEKSFGGQVLSTLGAPAALFARFQVGGCKSLPYKPKLSARLYGPTHRGAHPRFRGVFTAKSGEANTAKISFTFPKSEFIDQAHFRTICTRVQFAANACPAGSVYGHVKAYTPLLDYPLEGPAYLRSSSHKLPDLVLALRGPASQPIAFDAVGRVDSVNGGLRVRFQEVPDAPISKVIVSAQGAKKGLFQNSTNICKGIHRATLKLDSQSGKVSDSQPKLVAQCPKGTKKPKKAKGGGGR